MRQYTGFVIAAVLGILLAIMATTPPAPRDASAPAAGFSAGRAMIDVRVIAARPHPTGTQENAEVRQYIARRMAELGMEVSTTTGTVDAAGTAKRNGWTGRDDPPQTLTNVVGILPGKDRSLPAIMLMSHHDTVWGSPGASDDTAGVATSLEVVRAIAARGQPQRDLIVLVTDAEELGLQGARQFFASDPLRERVGAVINMEARGGGGRTTLFETSRDSGAAVRLYADVVGRPAASSLAVFVYSVLPNDTDLTPVMAGSWTGYNFAFIGRSGLYHSPLATPDRLDQGSLQDMGAQVLALTTALLDAAELPAHASDVVFFDLFGLMTLVYPVWLGWVMLGIAILCLALVIRREGRSGIAGGAGRMTGLIVLGALLLYAFNRLSLGLGPTDYYDRLAAIPRLEAMALFAGIGAFVLVMGRWRPAEQQVTGAALPIALLALVAQAAAPTAAYVVVVPLMLSALGLLLRWPSLRILLAALVTGYMLALGHQLIQGVGPSMPYAAAIPLALAALAMLPLWRGIGPRAHRALAIASLVAAAALALWVQLDEPAASRAVYADSKN